MESFTGHLLVASPQLMDPNFAHSLVFLIQHSEEGALGVVLNRPVGKTIQDLWREVGSAPCHSQRPVYLGGPVSGPLLALHSSHNLAETEPAPGVFFAAQKHHLDQLVLSEEPVHKIFVGHSGWGAGQLENEIGQGAWRTVAATRDWVFSTDETLWETIFRRLGQSVLKSVLGMKDLPGDPTLN